MIRSAEAKQICTKTEFELFTNSRARSIKSLTEKDLAKAVTRSRRARDKYRSLAERQRRESRGKQQPRGSRAAKGSQRTERKAELFAETLDRYQARLAELKAPPKPAKKAKKKPAASKSSVAKKTAPKKKPAAKKAAKKPASKKTSTSTPKKVAKKTKKKELKISGDKTATMQVQHRWTATVTKNCLNKRQRLRPKPARQPKKPRPPPRPSLARNTRRVWSGNKNTPLLRANGDKPKRTVVLGELHNVWVPRRLSRQRAAS